MRISDPITDSGLSILINLSHRGEQGFGDLGEVVIVASGARINPLGCV